MRAEANRQKYNQKKQYVERMGRVTEWDRHKMLLQSEAKSAKTDQMMDTKKELQKQVRILPRAAAGRFACLGAELLCLTLGRVCHVLCRDDCWR